MSNGLQCLSIAADLGGIDNCWYSNEVEELKSCQIVSGIGWIRTENNVMFP